LTGRAACSVNLIRGGTQINIIPADCHVEVDRRIVPGEDPAAVLPETEALLEKLREADAGLMVRQEAPFIDPPLDPAGTEWFAGHVAAVLEAHGLDSRPQGAPYGTDGSTFSAAGVPSIVLGPGDIAQAHKAEEWLELEQLEKAVEVYLALMQAPPEKLIRGMKSMGKNSNG
jgi:acetylornithine deacetylase